MSIEALVLSASLAYAHDAEPRNPSPRAMAADLVAAVADGATSTPLPGKTAEWTAAALIVWGFRESAYNTSAQGDCPGMRAGSRECRKAAGARSCGAFQTPCERTVLGDAKQQVALALSIMATSFAMCGDFSAYIAGDCVRGARLSALRTSAVERLLVEVGL